MGKNASKKKGPKGNVFKVAGAKSLKKSKAKAVNLGLKNITHKIREIDAQFVEIDKTQKITSSPKITSKLKVKKPQKKEVTKEDIADAAEEMVKMDL